VDRSISPARRDKEQTRCTSAQTTEERSDVVVRWCVSIKPTTIPTTRPRTNRPLSLLRYTTVARKRSPRHVDLPPLRSNKEVADTRAQPSRAAKKSNQFTMYVRTDHHCKTYRAITLAHRCSHIQPDLHLIGASSTSEIARQSQVGWAAVSITCVSVGGWRLGWRACKGGRWFRWIGR
jgi:hypothetical protein